MFSTFILSLLIGFVTPTVQPVLTEELHILFIQGQILNKTTGTLLQRGAKLKSTDKVVFKSADGKAIVLSNVRGRFVMSANPAKINSEVGDVVSGIISPLKTNSKLSTRGSDDAIVSDLKAHFGKTDNNITPTFIMIGDKYDFKVNKGAMGLTEGEFLAVVYKATDSTDAPVEVTKLLGSSGDIGAKAAALNKEKLFKTKKGQIDPAKVTVMELHKSIADKKVDATVLASFRPVFVNSTELVASFKEYLTLTNIDETLSTYMANNPEALAKLPKMTIVEKKKELLFYYLCECYAKPSENGEVDVNTVKVDDHALTEWLTVNKL